MMRQIAVVGLGYVGLPVAVAFGKKHRTIAFDINSERIEELRQGYDRTYEVSSDELKDTDVVYTEDKEDLKQADFIIIAVPTPINAHNQPDLTPLIKASETVGSVLQAGTIVVYESTVYPGATEDICAPVLEAYSRLKQGKDFYIGYSPERINPGDKDHTFTKITKVVSGENSTVLDIVAETYESVVTKGVYRAKTIRVAEAAKVIENTQRDVNVALMNELAVLFDRLGIDTKDVLDAAGTKWNFLKFSPGLVGGHCIGVDPYYLTYKAQEVGHHPEIILAGRRINDSMAPYIAITYIKEIIQKGLVVRGAEMNFLGLTFKENTPDLRNTKMMDLIREFETLSMNVNVHDPLADKKEAKKYYDIDLKDLDALPKTDFLVLAVAHDEYKNHKAEYLKSLSDEGIVCDIKGLIEPGDLTETQSVWRL